MNELGEIYRQELRQAAREAHGLWRQVWTELYPSVAEMERERYPAASGEHVGRPGKRNRKREARA